MNLKELPEHGHNCFGQFSFRQMKRSKFKMFALYGQILEKKVVLKF